MSEENMITLLLLGNGILLLGQARIMLFVRKILEQLEAQK